MKKSNNTLEIDILRNSPKIMDYTTKNLDYTTIVLT